MDFILKLVFYWGFNRTIKEGFRKGIHLYLSQRLPNRTVHFF